MRSLFWIHLGIVFILGALLSCGGSGGAQDTTVPTAKLSWYSTCGEPVCGGYRGPFPGVPLCTTEKAGDICATANAQCDPKSMCDALLLCADKDPKQQTGGCPISRALYKRDIRYLSEVQKKQIYQEIQALKLASYRYTDAGPSGAQRLGFVIDDIERSVGSTLATSALNAERDQVDLYGYISMAVATLQVQAKQIEALRAEMKVLRETAAVLRAAEHTHKILHRTRAETEAVATHIVLTARRSDRDRCLSESSDAQ
jgi:hypothetical protein